jgi:hypothetical protein
LIQAAIDWRRCGLSRPIPEDCLEELTSSYIPLIRVNLALSRSLFDHALSWAMQPVASQVALLRRLSPDKTSAASSFEVLDYVVAADDGQGGRTARPIPESTWSTLLAIVPAYEGLNIGMAAHLRQQPRIAVQAFKAAANCGHPDYYSAGAFNVAVLLAEEDFDDACHFFDIAIRSGHLADAPAAAVELGILLARRARTVDSEEASILLDRARAAFQTAIDYDHPVESPRAISALATLASPLQDGNVI